MGYCHLDCADEAFPTHDLGMNIGHGAELRWVITADLVAAGQGLHARSVCPAHHTLLLLTTGRLLVLTIDFTKEIVLDDKGNVSAC